MIDRQQILLPKDAIIQSIINQNEIPCIYAMVDSDEYTQVYRDIVIYGTGHEMVDEAIRFIGTFCLVDCALVFHAYEVL